MLLTEGVTLLHNMDVSVGKMADLCATLLSKGSIYSKFRHAYNMVVG